MTKTKVTHYCDICKKKYDGEKEHVKYSRSFKDFSGCYVGGDSTEYKEVCNDCTEKIHNFIESIKGE